MVVPFLRCRDSLDAIRKFDEAIYQNLENPQIGESTQELKLRRGQRPTLVDAGQDGYAFCLLLFVLSPFSFSLSVSLSLFLTSFFFFFFFFL